MPGAASASPSSTFRGTIWNQTMADRLRGRLAGLRVSIISGGVLCIAGAAVAAALLPAFRRYEAAPVASGG